MEVAGAALRAVFAGQLAGRKTDRPTDHRTKAQCVQLTVSIGRLTRRPWWVPVPRGRGEEAGRREGIAGGLSGRRQGLLLTDGRILRLGLRAHVGVGEHGERCDDGARGQSSEHLREALFPSLLREAGKFRLLAHGETV